MKKILLIYPYFNSKHDKSAFRFPPLGIGYIASSLRAANHEVRILDCTFISKKEAIYKALSFNPEIVGIYCMITMRDNAILFAKHLKVSAKLLIAGGPLPSSDPTSFLEHFDVVVIGEGEKTAVEIVTAYENRTNLIDVPGITFRTDRKRGFPPENIMFSANRPFQSNLDSIPFPARDLLPNKNYIHYGRKRYGYAITTIMSTRGCPFECEFCSNTVFGTTYRERSAENVLEEVENALSFGYDYIHFGDDVFTLNKERIKKICREIRGRGLHFRWECLGRVDSIDNEIALEMKQAGCEKIYFGIESGNDSILKLMNKKINIDQARKAVETARSAGLKTGAFFILFYPGDTNDTVLETIRYAVSLPLDYLSFTVPYPISGTKMYERVKNQSVREWIQPNGVLCGHKLVFDAGFSELKMLFGIFKGQIEFEIKKQLGKSPIIFKIFEKMTDFLLKILW